MGMILTHDTFLTHKMIPQTINHTHTHTRTHTHTHRYTHTHTHARTHLVVGRDPADRETRRGRAGCLRT